MLYRFIHTADWHADSDPDKSRKLEASLGEMVDYCLQNKVNAIIIAGDIWERKQTYAEKSGVPLVVTYLRHLSKLVDYIFITKGNNAHDEPGSVALLHQLEQNIYAFESPVVMAVGKSITDILRHSTREEIKYIVSMVPYPTKANFITETSIDNNNADFLKKFEGIFELIGDRTDKYYCPKILAFHGNVVGSRLSSGQSLVSQDIMVAPSTLDKARHDYYALGHIHLRQAVKENMVYSGSIYNKSWGETEQKSFEVVEFKGWQLNSGEADGRYDSYPVNFTNARPMVTVECTLNSTGKIEVPSDVPGMDDEDYYQYRVKLSVAEADKKLLNETITNSLKQLFHDDVKIEVNIIPSERESRSEQIMSCKTLLEEVKEFATVINEPVNGNVSMKVDAMQEAAI